MSKQKINIKPFGEAGLAKCREITENKQAGMVNGKLVDLYTASKIVKVYDSVNEQNKAKLLSVSLLKVVDVVMSL